MILRLLFSSLNLNRHSVEQWLHQSLEFLSLPSFHRENQAPNFRLPNSALQPQPLRLLMLNGVRDCRFLYPEDLLASHLSDFWCHSTNPIQDSCLWHRKSSWSSSDTLMPRKGSHSSSPLPGLRLVSSHPFRNGVLMCVFLSCGFVYVIRLTRLGQLFCLRMQAKKQTMWVWW